MNITFLVPQSEFPTATVEKLKSLGSIKLIDSTKELPQDKIEEFCKDADVLGIDERVFGGFEKATPRVTALLKTLPHLSHLAIATTTYAWIDLDYCNSRKLPVTNVPFYSTESVAEHTLALLLCLAKNIIVSDRQTRNNNFTMQLGFELKGKTLGVIGLGHIGSRVAELGKAIGMNVIGYNRSPKQLPSVKQVSLDELLKQSDCISIHVKSTPETKQMINKEKMAQMKKGCIVVNTGSRTLINEDDMAQMLTDKHIAAYAFEGEDLTHGPLANIETAIGLQGFAWYTKESLERNAQIWIDNIINMIKETPTNVVTK